MKLSLLASILLGSFLASSASADTTKARIDLSWFKMKMTEMQDVMPKSPPSAQQFKDLQEGLKDWDIVQAERRRRLHQAISDLDTRARNFYLHMNDLLILRGRFIDAALDVYMDDLIAAAMARKATREQFQYVLDLLDERVELAMTPPDVRAALNEAVEQLKKRFQENKGIPISDVTLLADELLRVRMNHAVTWLMDSADRRHLSTEQFQHVLDLLTLRAGLWNTDPQIRERVEYMKTQISHLMDRALQCDLSREEIQAYYADLMQRARAAL